MERSKASTLLEYISVVLLTVISVILIFDKIEWGRSSSVELIELDYWHTKSEIVNEVQQYIDTKAPGSDLSGLELFNACEELNFDVKFALVQGLIESHFGTRGLALKTNSVWNVGAYDGLSEGEIKKVHKFDHPNKSIKPYIKLVKSNYLGDTKVEVDLLDNYVDLKGNRYASYPYYERDLKVRYEEFNNSKLDSLLVVYHKQQLKFNR